MFLPENIIAPAPPPPPALAEGGNYVVTKTRQGAGYEGSLVFVVSKMIPCRSYRSLSPHLPKLPLTVPCVLAGWLETSAPAAAGNVLGLYKQAGGRWVLGTWALH